MSLKDIDIDRHNKITDLIFEKVNKYLSCENVVFFKDKFLKPSNFDHDIDINTEFVTRNIRPDIAVVDHESKTVKLIEISTPFDAHIDLCFSSKCLKYSPLATEIDELGFNSEVIVFIVGSLGSIHSKFLSGLMKCSLPKHEAIFLIKYLNISSIIGSFKVWRRRCKLHFRYE